jgi:hypothetical protein
MRRLLHWLIDASSLTWAMLAGLLALLVAAGRSVLLPKRKSEVETEMQRLEAERVSRAREVAKQLAKIRTEREVLMNNRSTLDIGNDIIEKKLKGE